MFGTLAHMAFIEVSWTEWGSGILSQEGDLNLFQFVTGLNTSPMFSRHLIFLDKDTFANLAQAYPN